MGWGISIDQDEDGFVYCEDANFETDAGDYHGYPPSSYDFIYEHVERCRGEIDGARDEMGIDEAHVQCREAFVGAKQAWRRLAPDERNKIHEEYVKDLKKQIRECRVDRKRQKEKMDQILFYEKRFGPDLSKLDREIADLEARLEAKRQEYKKVREPLTILESELSVINEPIRAKELLQKRLEMEEEFWNE
jgi:chromosome segregation ATPase